MGHRGVLVLVISLVGAMAFIPHGSIGEKDPILTEALLREVVERMGKDFNEAASTYLELPPSERRLAMMARASQQLQQEQLQHEHMQHEQLQHGQLQHEQLDYDSLIEGNPSPSLRDQEYLQHSSLWGHQYVTGGAGEGEQRLQPSGVLPNRQMIKTDAVLPAYCNPPNPCPVGYTEEQGCISEFENTAAYSREYQLAQRCMCDGEHMFSCPPDAADIELRFPDHHKSLAAKKFNIDIDNPYLLGERLPIAAKKGFDVRVF
ncbi:PREDICTED: neuroendocrine protein 7B2 [Papilio xuthus]|uniref:Neuroendocrine protein 7B2 n=1 Tax=Papilio xuthus TaxID=66420 RepID=A0A194PV22_PAPXU|nr:PREDICTED: neuroendocrine protein 7B2 [Papilio xuthus]XP_013176859.1 PREDICTED: neuroendocrine protein 7B2 [Papilio xuthus]XP_013176868.1 PREDICTED: neuroendocrine protein 7B2 [Papilio xuthus]XP_013176877.1 PREDICTED: neuroendocrine protein 7B2 [Papilio xuthus]KPI96838.1 Neuroendocrine protein 7B2 [Papilio xuthus]